MKLRLSKTEMHAYRKHYKMLKSKFDKGQFISELARDLNVHPSTIHRHFNDFEEGFRPAHRKDKGSARIIVNGETLTAEEKKEIALKIAATKISLGTKTGKTGETGKIAEGLYRAGEIPMLLPRTTANRWLNQFNFSFKQIRNYADSTVTRLTTDRPNRWWFVDASVSELYYLGSRNRIVRDSSGIIKDKNHREEVLTKKGYRKLIIFGAVDLYSRAYWFNAYVVPGESAAAYMRFLMDAMQAKDDQRNPFRGIPENIYSDRGSGIYTSIATKEMLASLGINLAAHFPGNAKAKGVIEARIGAYKNNIERYFAFEKIETLERYRKLKENFVIADNLKKGHYELWSHIHKHPGALREFSPELRGKVGYVSFEQKVGPRGCVTIDNVDYFVDRRLNGEWVTVYRLADGIMKAQDRMDRIFEIHEQKQEVEMGKFRAAKKTDYDRELETIEEESKRLKTVLKPEHFIPENPETNIVLFDKPGIPAEVNSPLNELLIETPADAWYRILLRTGYSAKDLHPEIADKISWLLETIINTDGALTGSRLNEITEIVSDTMRETREASYM